MFKKIITITAVYLTCFCGGILLGLYLHYRGREVDNYPPPAMEIFQPAPTSVSMTFEPTEIIASAEPTAACDEGEFFILQVIEGKVYSVNGITGEKELTDISYAVLPEKVKAELVAGIQLWSIQELREEIENLTS